MPGDWIQTYTGMRFYPLAPRVEDVDVTDVAHALSLLCRFTGQIRDFYSVGDHSIRVSDYLRGRGCSAAIQFAGLLHDATEAYLADVNRPVKHSDAMAGYRQVEARLERAIFARFDLPYESMPVEVKEADNAMLGAEARDLFVGGPRDDWDLAPLGGADLPRVVPVASPKEVETLFLRRFYDLRAEIARSR